MARILIVDDERDVVELVSYLLKKEGHDVLEASDGKAGLASVLKDKPDLIVLDIMMPEMDGYTMNKHLLENAEARNIPVLVLTAQGGQQETSAMAPNIRYHIEKPFDSKDLKDRIVTILKNKPS